MALKLPGLDMLDAPRISEKWVWAVESIRILYADFDIPKTNKFAQCTVNSLTLHFFPVVPFDSRAVTCGTP
jgi:hypothetical protein